MGLFTIGFIGQILGESETWQGKEGKKNGGGDCFDLE